MKSIRAPLWLLSVVATFVVAHAQFIGGAGGGSAVTSLNQSFCTYTYPVIYVGGNDNITYSGTIINQNCPSWPYPNIYAGGLDDGYTNASVQQESCASINFPNIYAGGIDDGYSMLAISQVSCNPLAFPNIYAGGIDDGYGMLTISQESCNPLAFPNIYAGGIDDGYSGQELQQQICVPPALPNIYAGGNDDGYSMLALSQVSCNPLAFPNIYAGGVDDGYSMQNLAAGCYPYADFTADTTYICRGDTIHFTDMSMVLSTGPTGWQWDIQGATFVSDTFAQNPYAVFDTSGVFTVTLTAYYGTFGSTVQKTNYITVYPRPNATITASGPTTFCEGDSVRLTISPSGYTYQWNTGQTTQSIYASASGNYWATVTSAHGCSAKTNVITVNNLPAPKPLITTNGSPIVCNGDTLGLTSSPAQSYQWIPSGETTQHITVNVSGTYRVSVTYNNGCSRISDPITVTFGVAPAKPTIYASGPLTFCNGDSVTLTSSVADSYAWHPGGNTTQSIVVKNPGTYMVEVGNGTGCTSFSDPVTVTVLNSPAKPVITPSGPTTFCLGDSITLTSSPEYGYHWYPTNDSTQSIVVHNGGTYYVEVFNSIGCKSISDPLTVQVLPPVSTPTITASGPLNICAGDSVILTSTPSVNYYWFPTGETTQSIVVKDAGTYYVMVGGGSCSAISNTLTVTVYPVPSKPTITTSGPLTFCSGDSVVLTSSAAAGYSWNPGGQTTQSIVVYNSGQYFVEVNSGGSCTARSDTITVTVLPAPANPVITVSGPTTFCYGDSVVLTSSNATEYLWYPNGQTSQSITVTQSGNYYVRVGNGTGCYKYSTPIAVNVVPYPAKPIVSASGPTTFCEGDSVVLSSSPASAYEWVPTGNTTASIVVTQSGTYYVMVGTMCKTASDPVQVTVLQAPAKPIITPLGSTHLCSGDSVILTTTVYDAYQWYPGNETTQSITVTSGAMYYVRVFNNATGCSSISDPVFVDVSPRPTVNVLGPSVACLSANENYTTYQLPNVTYLWTVNNGYVVSGNNTNDVLVHFYDTGFAYVGVHVLDITSGCANYDSLQIHVLYAPHAYAGKDVTICKGDTVQLYGTGGSQMQWQPSLGLSDPTSSTPLASPPYTIDYVLVTSNGSCTDFDTVRVTVVDRPHVDAGPDLIASGNDTCVMLLGYSLTPGVTYLWYPPFGLSDPHVATPLACVSHDTTMYILAVSNGVCSSTDTTYVYRIKGGEAPGDVSFVNSFSPNGDGVNDTWIIINAEKYPRNKLSVFNRWGNKVYEAKPYMNNWDGTSIGKPLPDGTYYFIFDKGNGDPPYSGYVTIIRE